MSKVQPDEQVVVAFTFTAPGRPSQCVEPRSSAHSGVRCRADEVLPILRHYRASSVTVSGYGRPYHERILADLETDGTPAHLRMPASWPDAGGRLSLKTLERQKYGLRPPDNQRQRVYDWENAHLKAIRNFAPSIYSKAWELERGDSWLAELRTLAERVKLDYQLSPKLTVSLSQRMRGAHFVPLSKSIKLSVKFAYRWTLLHELAHAIVDMRIAPIGSKVKVASHGPEFVAVYVELLERYLGVASEPMLLLADQRGVRYVSREQLSQLLSNKSST